MSPHAKRFACLSAIVGLLALGWLLLLFADQEWLRESFFILIYGTMFGQVALAAAWLALGPLSLASRIALSSIWLAAVILAPGFNTNIWLEMMHLNITLTFSVIVLCQVVLVIIPVAVLSSFFGWRFAWEADHGFGSQTQDRQLGIREAMILTAAVAVVLGAARYRYGDLRDVEINWGAAVLLGLGTVSSVVVAVPTTVYTLFNQRRRWLPAIIIGVSTVTTVIEGLTVQLMNGGLRIPLSAYLFPFLVNVTECSWIVLVILVLKLGGYRFISSRLQPAVEQSEPSP